MQLVSSESENTSVTWGSGTFSLRSQTRRCCSQPVNRLSHNASYSHTDPYRRDNRSSFSCCRELSAPTEEAPAGSWLSLSITSRPLSSAIWWMRSSTCSWGVVSVIAEPMESSITWCRNEMLWMTCGYDKSKHKPIWEYFTKTARMIMCTVCNHSLRCGRRGSEPGFQTYPWLQRPFGGPWSSELCPGPWSPGPCFWWPYERKKPFKVFESFWKHFFLKGFIPHHLIRVTMPYS